MLVLQRKRLNTKHNVTVFEIRQNNAVRQNHRPGNSNSRMSVASGQMTSQKVTMIQNQTKIETQRLSNKESMTNSMAVMANFQIQLKKRKLLPNRLLKTMMLNLKNY